MEEPKKPPSPNLSSAHSASIRFHRFKHSRLSILPFARDSTSTIGFRLCIKTDQISGFWQNKFSVADKAKIFNLQRISEYIDTLFGNNARSTLKMSVKSDETLYLASLKVIGALTGRLVRIYCEIVNCTG